MFGGVAFPPPPNCYSANKLILAFTKFDIKILKP